MEGGGRTSSGPKKGQVSDEVGIGWLNNEGSLA